MARNRSDFAVWVPDPDGSLRRKQECLAKGSMRALGPTVAVLIAKEDATKPEWNRRRTQPRPPDDPDLFRPEMPQREQPHA